MAAGCSSGKVPVELEKFTCTLCLDIFQSPKFLPCHHTFCLGCLIQLVSSSKSPDSFRCPSCRLKCFVPDGGVCNFQTNYYLGDLDKLRDERCGQDHDNKHKGHAETDPSKEFHASQKTQWEALHEKRAAIEEAIFKKYAAVVALAEKFRDDSLVALRRFYDQSIVELRRRTSTTSRLLLRRMFFRSFALDTCEGEGSTGAAKEPSLPKRTISHYFLNTIARFEVVAESVKKFLGCVYEERMENTEPEVTTVKKFQCEMETDTEIWSLCPLEGGKYVWISYNRFDLHKDMPCKKFDEAGGLRLTSKTANGRCSFQSRKAGESLFAEESQSSRLTFSKSERDQHIKLSNYCKGTASIKRVKVKSEDPFDTEEILESRINVGPHCAFDADSSGQFYVVIEEVKTPEPQRKVHLYRHKKENAVATYSSPINNFQPSDVCFYKLGDKEVLIVADEGTSRLHVVEVGDNKMVFNRFLDLACPLLVQPTALNTDTKGRLWVACRWGAILMMTPIV